ncbi:MAG: hypothetical protein KGI54_09110 [Pseudomonadota bacterium]|nr:hypothetical protein [Pseudomonadota bacterium]
MPEILFKEAYFNECSLCCKSGESENENAGCGYSASGFKSGASLACAFRRSFYPPSFGLCARFNFFEYFVNLILGEFLPAEQSRGFCATLWVALIEQVLYLK